MTSELKQNSSLKLDEMDKSNWKILQFDQIAENISERVDPNNTDLQCYVGLEHLDSNSIHINRHGTPDDVNGQKLRFYKGDIIFGRRRAYLRKAAVAKTDGFCSAHALVLRAKKDVIDPLLFPFFMHSDTFMHKAIDISVGSLSPTINWGTLKHQEFRVPPKSLQTFLVDIFTKIDKARIAGKIFDEKLSTYYIVKSRELLQGLFLKTDTIKHKNMPVIPSCWKLVQIGQLFEKVSTKNKNAACQNVLTISAKGGLVNQEEYFNKSVASKDLSNYFLLENGDFAYNKSYSDGYPAGAIKRLKDYQNGVVSPLYICFKALCSDLQARYFEHLFESGFLNQQILAVAKEGARNHGLLNVAVDDFFGLKIPLPDDFVIEKILIELNRLGDLLSSNADHTEKVSKLQESIINKVF